MKRTMRYVPSVRMYIVPLNCECVEALERVTLNVLTVVRSVNHKNIHNMGSGSSLYKQPV